MVGFGWRGTAGSPPPPCDLISAPYFTESCRKLWILCCLLKRVSNSWDARRRCGPEVNSRAGTERFRDAGYRRTRAESESRDLFSTLRCQRANWSLYTNTVSNNTLYFTHGSKQYLTGKYNNNDIWRCESWRGGKQGTPTCRLMCSGKNSWPGHCWTETRTSVCSVSGQPDHWAKNLCWEQPNLLQGDFWLVWRRSFIFCTLSFETKTDRRRKLDWNMSSAVKVSDAAAPTWNKPEQAILLFIGIFNCDGKGLCRFL